MLLIAVLFLRGDGVRQLILRSGREVLYVIDEVVGRRQRLSTDRRLTARQTNVDGNDSGNSKQDSCWST